MYGNQSRIAKRCEKRNTLKKIGVCPVFLWTENVWSFTQRFQGGKWTILCWLSYSFQNGYLKTCLLDNFSHVIKLHENVGSGRRTNKILNKKICFWSFFSIFDILIFKKLITLYIYLNNLRFVPVIVIIWLLLQCFSISLWWNFQIPLH